MKKKNLFIVLAFIAMLTLLVPTQARADSSLAVAVKAILPENQHNQDVSYYDIRMQPGQQQELELELTNTSAEEQVVELQINDATTNDGGSIDYSDRGGVLERDNSLQAGFALTDIASVPQSVTVPANGKEIVKIAMNMPKESFDGLILGAIRIMPPDEEQAAEESTSNGGGMQIRNKVAYSISIAVSETDTPVDADLDFIKAYADQNAGRNVVKATIQNFEASVLEDIAYTAEIYKKGSDKVLHQNAVTGYRFAPNSSFDFQVSWEGTKFEAGTYRIHMTAASKDETQSEGKRFWEWDEEFEISADEAKRLNESAIDLEEDNTLFYIIVAVIVGVLLLLLLLLLFLLKKRKEKKKREEMIRRKKMRERARREQERRKSGKAKQQGASKKLSTSKTKKTHSSNPEK